MSVFSGPADWWTDGTNIGRTHIATKGVVQSGLVLNLDAGVSTSYPGSGTTWTDLSGNGNTGTLTNGPTYDSTNGGYIVFDGTNDYVNIVDAAILDLTASITSEAWVFAVKSTGIQNVISKSSSIQNNGYIYPRTDNGWNNCSFYLNIGTWTTLSTAWPSRNAWHHTAATYDGNAMSIYINGNLVASKSQTGAISTNTNALSIGDQPGYSEYFGGNLSNLRLYNRALTAAEVKQNFNALRGRFGI
jgi:hypothetical protein